MKADKIEEAAKEYKALMNYKSKHKDYKHMSQDVLKRSTALKICRKHDISLKFFKKMMI